MSQNDPGATRRVHKLSDRIAEARHLRGLVRDPDLQAVEMERRGRRTLRALWFFLSLGLVFTTTGVQQFLAAGATPADPAWWAAWTVEPMFAGLLISLLNFEAAILAHGIAPDHPWWSRLKSALLVSTMTMNVLPQLAPLVGSGGEFNVGSLAVHAVIPVIVYGLAEVIPVIQARQRQVITQAYDLADQVEPAPAEDAEQTATPEEPEPDTVPAENRDEPIASEPSPARELVSKGPKLPAAMLERIARAKEAAHAEGRELTAADVQRVVKVPETLAEQIAADHASSHAMA